MDIDKAWKFDRGHWEIIDHPMSAYDDRENLDSPEDMFYLAGYNANSSLTLGRWGLAFHVDVHLPYPRSSYKDKPISKPKYPYFVSIFLVVEYVPIYVVDFPSLLMLLHQVSTIVGQTEELYQDSKHIED
jgi:hypothetical protein